MIETDVIVVGSGPAGSSAAKHAALGGAKVILMDKKSEIGAPKRCAEGVSIQGLEKLGIEPSPRWVTQEIEGVRLQAPDGTDVWLTKDEVINVCLYWQTSLQVVCQKWSAKHRRWRRGPPREGWPQQRT